MNIKRILFFFIFIVVFYGGMNFYVGRSLFRWLIYLYPHIHRPIFTGSYMLIALSVILSRFSLPVTIKRPIAWIGAHWLGILIYFLLFFLLADFFVLIGSAVRLIPSDMLQSVRFYAGTAAIISTIGVVCYGLYNAKRIIDVNYEIDIQPHKSLSSEMNIVVISDLHLGDINSEKRLEYIVSRINSLEPDIVCILGDIFRDDFSLIRDPGAASAHFKNIKAAYGVFAVLGNHDSGNTLPQMMDFLERSNVVLLNDEHVVIDGRLVLIGRLDASPIRGFGDMSRKPFAEIIADVDTELPIVIMDHSPAHIEEYGSEIDLILAGHTHRGQIFPGVLLVKRMYEMYYGHYRRANDGVHVIITQGVHTWMMPMRVGTNNEVVSVVVR